MAMCDAVIALDLADQQPRYPGHCLHGKHGTEASLVGHHVLESLIGLGKREGLAHALDVKSLAEGDGILRIEGMTRRPAMHRDALGDHSNRVDRDISNSCRDDARYAQHNNARRNGSAINLFEPEACLILTC